MRINGMHNTIKRFPHQPSKHYFAIAMNSGIRPWTFLRPSVTRLQKHSNRWGWRYIARLASLSLFGLASVLMPQQEAYGAQLTRWLFDPTTHWLTLTVSGETSPHYFLLAQPPRIVVDLPNTQVHNVPEVTTYSGLVQSVRVGQFQPELTRIVIEFDPNITFAPGHITIQPGEPTASSGALTTTETWYIRPLLVGQGGEDAMPPGLVAAQEAVPAPVPLRDSSSGEFAIAAEDLAEDLPEDFASRNLPPLEPGAVELPVDSPNTLARTIAAPTSTITLDSEQSTDILVDEDESEPVSRPQIERSEPSHTSADDKASTGEALTFDDETANTVETLPISDSLDENEPNSEPPMADLPAPETAFLNLPAVDLLPDNLPSDDLLPDDLPSDNLPSDDLPSERTVTRAPERSAVDTQSTSVSMIAFGEAFGQDANAQSTAILDSVAPTEIPTEIPTARMLSLRYPRETSLQINGDIPRQEVLVVTRAVRDRAGDIVIPDGSLVIGRFEHMDGQLQFTPQALTIGDRTIRINNTTVDRLGPAIEPNQLIQMPLDETILGASL